MSPQLALLIFSLFIAATLFIDSRREPRFSLALWVPAIWFALLASRPLSVWLDPRELGAVDLTAAEGSSADRMILSGLMALSVLILVRRKLKWGEWAKRNPWIVLFFFYCALSIIWSEFPMVALRRWFRALGSVMVILVVLSEPDPLAA